MVVTRAKRSFAGGELSPKLYARTDISKYESALRTCRNMMVLRDGGASNRAGTTYVCEVKDSTKKTRIIEFVFNDEQTYVIELGDQYIRFSKDGNQVLEAAQNITGATQANPIVITLASHGYSNDDELYLDNVEGMTQLNNRNFKIKNVTANTFELYDMDGITPIDGTGYDVYTSGGTAAKVYEISSPYLEDELFNIQYVQSVDVITLAHQNHPPAELKRLGDTNWTLSDIIFVPDSESPTGVTASGGPAGTKDFRYKVTAVDPSTGEESLSGTSGTPIAISNITQADPAVVTATGHGLVDGDEIILKSIAGMTELNNRAFSVNQLDANTFELNGEDSTNHTAYASGGTAEKIFFEITGKDKPTDANPITITWTAPSGVTEFNIYKAVNGAYGLLGIANGTSFDDIGTDPDLTDGPPQFRNPFASAGNYPAVVTYIQQRLAFANTANNPERIETSQTGNFKNFNRSSPLKADDAISFTMVGQEVNEVRNLIDLRGLVILTSGGEWGAEGDNGVITPTDINNKQYGYNGSANLRPIIVGGSAIFLQARGSIIRNLGFEFQVDGYQGDDLTIFSSHLFDNYTIKDWSYQQIPHSILWVIRDDGKFLGLTYVREQQMLAWHRHDFQGGLAESITVIPEGNEDATYFVVKRTINGKVKRYIEKFTTRQITNIEEVKLMDSNLSYDGRNSTISHTMILSGGTNWDISEDLTLTSSTPYFSANDIGKEIHLKIFETDEDTNETTLVAESRCQIKAFTSSTEVTVRADKTVDAELRNVTTSSWSLAVKTLSGLWHLEGKDVSVFADGYVVASPNNSSYTTITVTNGSITLPRAYGLIHVGIPVTADMETLNIDTSDALGMDKNHQVTQVVMFVEETRGIWAGNSKPSGNGIDELTEYKLRENEGYSSPNDLKTDVIEVNIKGNWNNNGRVFIRQVDPIPLTVLAIAPSGYLSLGG